jgi:hypothetical protein
MNDSTHIKKAPEDHEAPLVSRGNMSDAEFCLEEMRKISKLIEDVSTSPFQAPFLLKASLGFGGSLSIY